MTIITLKQAVEYGSSGQRLKEFNSQDRLCNALSAILNRALIKVIKFIKELGRGKTPWLHYELPNGQRIASFISPKAFQGYWWNQERSITINKSTGAKYQVSDRHCTCPSWEYQVKTGKKSQCKHQDMRAEYIGVNLSDSLPVVNNSATGNKKFEIVENQSKAPASAENLETANDKITPSSPAGSGGAGSGEIKVQINFPLQKNSIHLKIDSPMPPAPCPPASSVPLLYNPSNRYKLNPEILLEGFELERSRDLTLNEYYLKAWSKRHLKAEPELKRIGRIIETDQGFMVGGMRGASRVTVPFQADAVGWLLRYNGIDYNKDIIPAFQEYQKLKKPCCHKCGSEFEIVLSWENEPDYCPNCGWVEKELSEIEKRRLAREERRLNAAIAAKKQAAKKNSQVNVVEAFGGFM